MIILIILILLMSFLMGAAIGSFLGVVIDRLPRMESIIFTPSHCVNCKAPIKWYQNIPVISYALLKGKCSNCESKIPIKYFLIEILFGMLGLIIGIIMLTSVINSF